MLFLAKKNGFEFFVSGRYSFRPWAKEEESIFVDAIVNQHKPFVYDRHFYHVDFALYGVRPQDAPAYVNLVRDPIERFVSYFHYMRRENRWEGKLDKPPQVG